MDPASIAGLFLQTSQLALQSGTALYQFIRDTRTVNAHIDDLASELKSLADTCRLVHHQLHSIARYYKCYEDKREDASLWASIKEKLADCNTTLDTLQKALEGLQKGGSNVLAQGVRQFKLNLRQHEIINMKARVHSHTSSLQVCLLVMDIKVSHLASKKIDENLGSKLKRLEAKMDELKAILMTHAGPVEEQSLLDFDDEAMQNEDSAIPVLVRVNSASNLAMNPGSEEERLLLDSNQGDYDAICEAGDQLGDHLVLKCAEETLSRGTSLYEGSVYEEALSVGDEADLPDSPQALNSAINDQDNSLPELELVGTSAPANLERPKIKGKKMKQPKRSSQIRIQNIQALEKEPENMPTQLQESFRKMREQLIHSGIYIPAPSPTPRAPYQQKALCLRSSRYSQGPVTNSLAELEYRMTDTADTPRYLQHIRNLLEEFNMSGIPPSRLALLDRILPPDATKLAIRRIAMTGRLGVGKSYVAAALIYLLILRSDMPAFWVSASQLSEDREALTELLRLKQPNAKISHWDWLRKLLRYLDQKLARPWMLVIDGIDLDHAEDKRLKKLMDAEDSTHGRILITTRHHSTADAFVKDGTKVDVDALSGVDGAKILNAQAPQHWVFDSIAHALEFDPFVITQVQSFIQKTGISSEAYEKQLGAVLEDDNWARGGHMADAATHLSPMLSDRLVSSTALGLVPILRTVLNPSWRILFDRLQETQPLAMKTLSMISAFGKTKVPRAIIARLAIDVLIDQCLLTQSDGCLHASRLMMIAHRVWLIQRDRMESAFTDALEMIANDHPDIEEESAFDQDGALAPFSQVLRSHYAESWILGNRTELL